MTEISAMAAAAQTRRPGCFPIPTLPPAPQPTPQPEPKPAPRPEPKPEPDTTGESLADKARKLKPAPRLLLHELTQVALAVGMTNVAIQQKQLAAQLGVNPVTIRRHARKLVSQGMLEYAHAGQNIMHYGLPADLAGEKTAAGAILPDAGEAVMTHLQHDNAPAVPGDKVCLCQGVCPAHGAPVHLTVPPRHTRNAPETALDAPEAPTDGEISPEAFSDAPPGKSGKPANVCPKHGMFRKCTSPTIIEAVGEGARHCTYLYSGGAFCPWLWSPNLGTIQGAAGDQVTPGNVRDYVAAKRNSNAHAAAVAANPPPPSGRLKASWL